MMKLLMQVVHCLIWLVQAWQRWPLCPQCRKQRLAVSTDRSVGTQQRGGVRIYLYHAACTGCGFETTVDGMGTFIPPDPPSRPPSQ